MKYALLALLVALLSLAHGGIYKFKNRVLQPGEELAWRFGAVTPADEPQISFLYAPLELTPIAAIASKLTFTSDAETVSKKRRVQVAMYHSDEAFRVGIDKLGRKHLCCTPELLDQKRCDRVGEMYMAQLDQAQLGASSKMFKVFQVTLNSSVVTFDENQELKLTGVYYYFLVNCEGANTRVDGRIVFLNPFGFLGVTEFPSLVFYSIATWVYVFSVMVWFLLCVVNYKDIFFLQVFIGVLFLVGFAEMAIWYGEYTFSNVTGNTSIFLVVAGVLASTIKKTLSRTLVLVTSMGLGIMVAKLEISTRIKIVFLTIVYAVCSGCLDLFQVLERNQASAQRISLIFLFAVSILDTIFYYWTFLSLSILLKQLASRRTKIAAAKMQLYKSLWWILLATVLVSVGLIVAQVVIVTSMQSADSTWIVIWWLRFAAWDVGYYLVLVAIAFLFRPMENNQRFALTDDDGNTIELDALIGKDAAEISALPVGVDLILEDAGEKPTQVMKND